MQKKNLLNQIVAIMPMAGEGLRFKNFGHKIPKPLIKIKSTPMFMKAAMSFSKYLKWIFVAQSNLKINSIFKNALKNFKSKKVIYLNKITKGQAATVFKAFHFLRNDKTILIHSCDLSFNIKMSEILKEMKKFDVLVFTSKGKKYNFDNPTQFSWVRYNSNKKKLEISLKKNFKDKKLKSRLLIGSFVFKNKKVLSKCLFYLFKKRKRIKKEYYIDQAASLSSKLGFKLGEKIIKNYKSWGSHIEMKRYN